MDATELLRQARQRRDAVDLAVRRSAQTELCGRARLAAQALRGLPGVARVRIFGSIARGTARPDSDIDLVVWGLLPTEEDRAWVIATRAAGTEALDLLRGEDLPAHLAVSVAAEGVEA